jgi:hypothetical protein
VGTARKPERSRLLLPQPPRGLLQNEKKRVTPKRRSQASLALCL